MNTKKILITTLLTLGALLLTSMTAFAQSSASTLEVQGLTVGSCNDPQGKFSFTAQVIVRDNRGTVINSLPNSASVDVQVTTNWHDEFFASTVSAEAMLSISVEGPNDIDFGRIHVTLQDNPSLSQTLYVTCSNIQGPEKPDVGTPVISTDGRLNFGHGDLMSALYMASDASNRPAIAVYDIDTDGKGVLAGRFTVRDYGNYIDNPPVQNTKLATIGNSTLFALTTGEFQVNIGPDSEGKTTRVIFDSIPPTRVDFR